MFELYMLFRLIIIFIIIAMNNFFCIFFIAEIMLNLLIFYATILLCTDRKIHHRIAIFNTTINKRNSKNNFMYDCILVNFIR